MVLRMRSRAGSARTFSRPLSSWAASGPIGVVSSGAQHSSRASSFISIILTHVNILCNTARHRCSSIYGESRMTSRVQLALNVSDIDQAVAFYENLFQTPPAKREPGYANFAVADPPLKLVLIEN